MVNQKLAIRVDAGTQLGMGHLMRCFSIALLLKETHRIHFYLMETDAPVKEFLERNGLSYTLLPRIQDAVVDAKQFLEQLDASDHVLLDSYSLKTEWQKEVKKAGHTLFVIDDLHAWHHVADHIINHSGGVKSDMYSCEDHTQLHLGYSYRMLRPAFMNGPAPRQVPPKFPGTVIISMGASDVPNNTLKLARACVRFDKNMQIHVLASRLNPHFEGIQQWAAEHSELTTIHLDLNDRQLYHLMAGSDALICPASTIALEGCSVGMLVFAGITADNQLDNYNGLIEAGLAIALGDINLENEDSLLALFNKQSLNSDYIPALLARQNTCFDFEKHALANVFRNGYHLRKADQNDLMLLFEWTNDPAVRANSFNKDQVAFEDHQAWFKKRLDSENSIIYILTNGQENIGMIRFDITDHTALLNFSISSARRGEGYGKLIVQLGIAAIKKDKPSVDQIQAYVLKHNIQSQKMFITFEEVPSDVIGSFKYVLAFYPS